MIVTYFITYTYTYHDCVWVKHTVQFIFKSFKNGIFKLDGSLLFWRQLEKSLDIFHLTWIICHDPVWIKITFVFESTHSKKRDFQTWWLQLSLESSSSSIFSGATGEKLSYCHLTTLSKKGISKLEATIVLGGNWKWLSYLLSLGQEYFQSKLTHS